MSTDVGAEACIEPLREHASDEERRKIQRAFKTGEDDQGAGDEVMGVRMGQMFVIAKAFIDMFPAEIERLLESPIHEVRAGVLSIMDEQARRKQTAESQRTALSELDPRRIDRIDNRDLVDLAAPFVIEGDLFDKPGDAFYELTRSTKAGEAPNRDPRDVVLPSTG